MLKKADPAGSSIRGRESTFSYNLFNQVVSATDPAGATTSTTYDSAGTVHTNLQYNGQFQDSESNLYYLRARYFDPATTQFITVDPLTASTGDRYTYAAGNPATFTDPLGLDAIDSIGTFLTGAADELSMGLGPMARNAMGIEWDPCSNQSAYQTGGVLASINPKGLLKGAGRLAWKGITRKAATTGVESASLGDTILYQKVELDRRTSQVRDHQEPDDSVYL